MAAKVSVTTEQTITTDVKLATRARQMVKARCEEHAQIAAQIKQLKARQDRIKGEVEDLFKKEDQGAALLDGAVVDGHRVKLVCGKTRRLDQKSLMKAFGLAQADLDDHTTEKDNTPYLKITAPGERSDD